MVSTRKKRIVRTLSKKSNNKTHQFDYDTKLSASQLLALLVRDKRISLATFRRILTCAGATPYDMFDNEGKDYRDKKQIIERLLMHGRSPDNVPQCPSPVETWLKVASLTPSEVKAALATGGTKKNRVTVIQPKYPVTIEHTAKDYSVLLNTAALYMITRAFYQSQKKNPNITIPKTPLLKRLFYIDMPTDKPACAAGKLRVVSNAHKTYAATNNCLQNVNTELHTLFTRYTTIHEIRKHLMLRRKPLFFQSRRVMNEHFVRNNGELRTSIAEIAFAVRHKWGSRDTSDVAVSKSNSLLQHIMLAGALGTVGGAVGGVVGNYFGNLARPKLEKWQNNYLHKIRQQKQQTHKKKSRKHE